MVEGCQGDHISGKPGGLWVRAEKWGTSLAKGQQKVSLEAVNQGGWGAQDKTRTCYNPSSQMKTWSILFRCIFVSLETQVPQVPGFELSWEGCDHFPRKEYISCVSLQIAFTSHPFWGHRLLEAILSHGRDHSRDECCCQQIIEPATPGRVNSE